MREVYRILYLSNLIDNSDTECATDYNIVNTKPIEPDWVKWTKNSNDPIVV